MTVCRISPSCTWVEQQPSHQFSSIVKLLLPPPPKKKHFHISSQLQTNFAAHPDQYECGVAALYGNILLWVFLINYGYQILLI